MHLKCERLMQTAIKPTPHVVKGYGSSRRPRKTIHRHWIIDVPYLVTTPICMGTPATFFSNISCMGTLPAIFRTIFPECIARVPVSLWGCGGRAVFAGRCVYVRNRPQLFATVRNRSQPSATVRKCPREGRMAVPIGSCAKGVTFGAFQRPVASFRVAGVALRGIPRQTTRRRPKLSVVAGLPPRTSMKVLQVLRLPRKNQPEVLQVLSLPHKNQPEVLQVLSLPHKQA